MLARPWDIFLFLVIFVLLLLLLVYVINFYYYYELSLKKIFYELLIFMYFANSLIIINFLFLNYDLDVFIYLKDCVVN